MSPTAHARLNDAYTACRQAGLPADTIIAFARGMIPPPWTASQQLFVALWLFITATICEQNPHSVTDFVALTPLLHTDPPDGVSQWMTYCLRALTDWDPVWANHLRQVLRQALDTP
ncbi:hypothetical protein [Sulfobacillus thermosulfidooxidans]|uniref:hypothetical protein n=1 Tax=Sulfobacillus thermosulfidooxidans TaxID=28034 RepID=UPI0003198B2C|nr:hypothetical protein [Sulfobacillus thermosulfidooxidans]